MPSEIPEDFYSEAVGRVLAWAMEDPPAQWRRRVERDGSHWDWQHLEILAGPLWKVPDWVAT